MTIYNIKINDNDATLAYVVGNYKQDRKKDKEINTFTQQGSVILA